MASALYNRYVPPKPAGPPPAVKISVTQAAEPPEDRALPTRSKPEDSSPAPKKEKSKKRKVVDPADGTSEEPSKRHKKEKKTKRRAVEAADDNEAMNEEPSEKHKTVFAKFEQSSKITEKLKKKKKKSKVTEEPEKVETQELHGSHTRNRSTSTDY
jgi:ATP-dependent RNA helicase DDX51/DBP6